ncbi:MAG: MFS transporter [Ruminococcaceae bacterium]|nr:MFS transporter [Oscillospiraceae bacterium]
MKLIASHRRLKIACYTSSLSMSVVGNLSPVLFLTFRSLYGISYSLLGLLVLINFVTQLGIDLIFSFFSHKFNIPRVIRIMPCLTVLGLLIYALSPVLFPDVVYLGLVIGTVIFSMAAGLGEVLISPVIATIPAPDPEREMSKLHSVYAWGVVGVIIVSTLFLFFVGSEAWQLLATLFAVIPLSSVLLFCTVEIPALESPERTSGALDLLKNRSIWLCIFAIFFGGAAECTMAQWCSGFIEGALGIPKLWGDLFGVALFSLMLGLGRTIYGKIGSHIGRVLFFGSLGAALCYGVAATVGVPVIGLIACALTGFCTSMLWPGNLVVAAERFPAGGVFIYAMMAAGGDLGASVGPQLVGVVTDVTSSVPWGQELAASLSLTPEQLGLKLGMLVGMLFPLLGAILAYRLWRGKKTK